MSEKNASKNPVSRWAARIALVALVVFVLYVRSAGDAGKLPGWLRPVAQLVLADGASREGAEAPKAPKAPKEAHAPAVSDRAIPKGAYHGSGKVYRILPDDNEGTRHQKFLLRLADGTSLLVAHNISLAPRIPDIEVGDTVEFCGEYVEGERGPLVHWTHRDPRGRHAAGWLRHNGKYYE